MIIYKWGYVFLVWRRHFFVGGCLIEKGGGLSFILSKNDFSINEKARLTNHFSKVEKYEVEKSHTWRMRFL